MTIQSLRIQTRLIRHCRRYKTMYHSASCIILVPFVMNYLFETSSVIAIIAGFCLFGVTGGWHWYKMIWKTLGRDVRAGISVLKMEMLIKKMIRQKLLLADVFEKNSKVYPDRIAYKDAETDSSLTFKEANDLSNQIASFFYNAGYRKGDTVALLMENRVEYIPIWMGLSKIGVITALINTNLREESLRHCIEISECKSLIYSDSFSSFVHSKNMQYKTNFDFYVFDNTEETKYIQAQKLKHLLDEIPKSIAAPPRPKDLSILDKMLFIYTSGTTGLPKAAVIRGTRYIYMGGVPGNMINMTMKDVCYGTLPLYHSNGGIVLAGSAIFAGATLVLRKKFSASKFFEDCTTHKCTVFNYIGEICRYLLAQPGREFDKMHNIRVCMGNGLRPSIWKEFQHRFNLPLICEFYGATEGNASMMNSVGKPGAVGFNSVLFPWAIPMKLVVRDEITGELKRDYNGIAITAKVGETGELVAKIRSDATKQFDGYINQQATKKKICCDVFSKGDTAFLSGDILIQDDEGYYYFQDRTGDTFRWKGENVSTNEVEGVISKSVKLNDVCVYGVEVNGIEGKAGMACIVDPQRHVVVEELYTDISKTLPTYARPVFIRLSNEIAKTGTHKFQKTSLRKESFNPTECGDDHLFYFDGKQKKYLPLDQNVYDEILNQHIRL